VFSLAAMSHVKISFELPIYTAQVNAIGTLNILEAIRMCGLTHLARFYQASTTELYGRVLETPQTETTPFYPLSPYATSKLFAYWITRNYRESYGMYAVNGILSNHESSRRSFNFVTRKITLGVGRIFNNEKDYILTLGNLDALRDWCSSRDCVRAMWLMLQQPAQPSPKDYVIGSGENHSVREFVEICFRKRGFDLEWKGQGLNEQGIDKRTGRILVQVNEKFMRPNEVDNLLTDPSLAHRELGWKPEITFDELIDEMLDVDCPRAEEPELE
jgi:GDPmannose 4,6-dehydratase